MSKALPKILDIWEDSLGIKCVVLDIRKRWFRYEVEILIDLENGWYKLSYLSLKEFMEISKYVSSKKLSYLFREVSDEM